jgi:hypothetical protein
MIAQPDDAEGQRWVNYRLMGERQLSRIRVSEAEPEHAAGDFWQGSS